MDLKLAEKILTFRKERALTQEQLAEVLGVSVGAVYKWEAGLSVPELDRSVEMADFFDSSVDVLLGYTLKDNRLKETVQRLREYRLQKDRAGLLEAEKALKKFPHAFEVVHASATLYRSFGVESGDENLHRRSLELLEQSLLLLPQNTDPEISEQALYGEMANAYLGLDEAEKAVDLASFFDESPSYKVSGFRFVSPIEGASAHDSLGPTATESLEAPISALKGEALSALWKSLKEEK